MPNQRNPAKEQFWRQSMVRFRTSGRTIRDFCAHERLSEASFYAWRAELARRDGDRAPGRHPAASSPRALPLGCSGVTPSAFVPVEVLPEDCTPSVDAGVDILCRGGRVIRLRAGFDRVTLGEAITALEALPC